MRDAMRGFRFTYLGATTAAALGLAATGANADGLGDRGGIKDRPYAAPLSWSGLYVGAAAAYGFGNSELDGIDFSLTGAQGVVAIGYDFQLSPRWVIGAFGDYAFGEIDGTIDPDDDGKLVIGNQWAVGGRLGLLATPSTLLYASAGYTRADFEVSEAGVVFVNKTLDGFFVGLGIEQAMHRNLFLKLDYRFSDYNDFTFGNVNFDNEVHSVRLGLNWKFGRD